MAVRSLPGQLVFLYKLVHSLIDPPNIFERVNLVVPRAGSRLRNRKTFYLNRFRTYVAQHSPIYRMSSSSNFIINDIDICRSGSLASFKKY